MSKQELPSVSAEAAGVPTGAQTDPVQGIVLRPRTITRELTLNDTSAERGDRSLALEVSLDDCPDLIGAEDFSSMTGFGGSLKARLEMGIDNKGEKIILGVVDTGEPVEGRHRISEFTTSPNRYHVVQLKETIKDDGSTTYEPQTGTRHLPTRDDPTPKPFEIPLSKGVTSDGTPMFLGATEGNEKSTLAQAGFVIPREVAARQLAIMIEPDGKMRIESVDSGATTKIAINEPEGAPSSARIQVGGELLPTSSLDVVKLEDAIKDIDEAFEAPVTEQAPTMGAAERIIADQITQLKRGEGVSHEVKTDVAKPAEENIAEAFEAPVTEQAPTMGAAERIIADQIAQLERGEGVVHEVKVDNAPPVEEAQDTAEESEEDQYRKAFAEAIQSPDTLMAVILQPAETEGGAVLQRELKKLVDSYNELHIAQESEAVWDKIIAPELKNISRQDTETMAHSLRETHRFLDSAAQGCDILRRAVFNGYRDGISNAINSMPVRPSEILERLSSGSYFEKKASYYDAVGRIAKFDFKALAEHEEVKKLAQKDRELSLAVASELHALIMRAGGEPESIGQAKNGLVAQLPEGDSWRRKMDTVQQIAQYARRIDLGSLDDSIAGPLRVAVGSLDEFVQGVRRGNYSGEAINTVTMKLNDMANEFEGAQRMARLVQNMAEFA